MRAIDIIVKKREGGSLNKNEIEFFLNSYQAGDIPDYQISAFLMAVLFQGMEKEELLHFTQTMTQSGDITMFPKKDLFIIDKHSTGGVGDKTSIALAPLLSSLGMGVAKLSGRGLGFTGGTIDKFESIEGFAFKTEAKDMIHLLEKTGIGLMGSSDSIVPIDKKLYALRDVTGTVQSVPLIASSIMSKKLALDSDAILLDVKVGNGSFMKTIEEAKTLAQTMYDIGKYANRNIACLLTNMNQPLGNAVGNALEFIEAVETLKGNGPDDFTELVLYLAGASLVLQGICTEIKDGIDIARKKLGTAEPLQMLADFITLSGGNGNVVFDYGLLKPARNTAGVVAERDGYIASFDTASIGNAAMILGAGRATKDAIIDHSVGLILKKKTGDRVQKGEDIAVIYYNDDTNVEQCIQLIQKSIVLSNEKQDTPSVVLDYIH